MIFKKIFLLGFVLLNFIFSAYGYKIKVSSAEILGKNLSYRIVNINETSVKKWIEVSSDAGTMTLDVYCENKIYFLCGDSFFQVGSEHDGVFVNPYTREGKVVWRFSLPSCKKKIYCNPRWD